MFGAKVAQEKKLAQIEAEKRRIEKQQAEIRKAQAIAEATINTAVSITKVLAQFPPPVGPNIAVAYGVLGAAQIALISAQKFAKGGRVDGPSHDGGGVTMAVPSQNRYVNLEGGEYVTNKRATHRNADVLERINTDGHNTRFSLVAHGNRFERGGMITKPNFQAIAGATGATNADNARIDRTNELLAQLVDKPMFMDIREVGSALNRVQIANRRART